MNEINGNIINTRLISGAQDNEEILQNLSLTSSSVGQNSSGYLGENVLGMSLNSAALKNQSSGLSLKSLASNHLKELPDQKASSGLSLGSVATNFLDGNMPSGLTSQSGTSGPGLSLSSLASNHLSCASANTKSGFQQGSTNSGLSLSSLASNHLGSGNNGAPSLGSLGSSSSGGIPNSSQFTIPAIFGPKPVTTPSPCTDKKQRDKERSVSPDVEIDLMSALNLSSAGQESLTQLKEDIKEEVKIVELTVPDLSRIKSDLRKRKRSEFSKVITRKWARREVHNPVIISLPTNNITVFQFTEPSPDDIVMKAQSQSKAFNRPSPVRQPVRT